MHATIRTTSVLVVLFALGLALTTWAAEAPKPESPPSDVGKQVQEPPASAGILEKDWFYQAEGKPLTERTLQEITWAREIAGRMSKMTGAPDLRAELAQLDQLEAAAKLAASAPPWTPSPVKLPDGLVGRWLNYQLDGEGFVSLNIGAKPAAIAAGNYTLCAWIRATENSGGDVIGNGTNPGCFLLEVRKGVAVAQCWPRRGPPAVIAGKTRVDDGQWHHVAQVVNDTTLSVVVDGKLEGSVAIADTKVASPAAVTIGARGKEVWRFAGTLDEICVFDRALSVEEIGAAFPVKRELEKDPADSSVRQRYLAVRQIKRRIMFKHPAIDFTQLLFIDQAFPKVGESNHETSHRLGWAASWGKLAVLDGLGPDGTVRELAPDNGSAAFWRPDLSFDARKVLFCMRPAKDPSFHLYEINLDGTGLRQLTDSNYDDLDPIYLPDGHVMFSTTRANTFIRCAPEMNSYVLARCDPDGKNIYVISRNNECDWLPALLPDGRVIYSRWEYSDKPLWRIQSLWTINPDGTGESVCWGNQSVWPDHLAMPRPIPGTHKIMFAGVGHHQWFDGSIGIIDTSAGGFNYPVGLTRVTLEAIWGEVGNGPQEQPHRADYHTAGKFVSFQTPWPLSEDLFLVSAQRDQPFDLYLMDVHGNRELIRRAQRNIFHAMPIRARSFPRLPDRVAWPGTGSNSTPAKPGVLYSSDVYDGVPNLPRGVVKFLRVIQQDHKTYSTRYRSPATTQGPEVSAVLVDSVKRILGTVPVRNDGSVMFEVPAGQALYFQLLDEHQRAVHTMRSFTGVMPGETRGCMGCHELHNTTPTLLKNGTQHDYTVSRMTPPPWGTNVTVGYERFVQPVLDKHCGKCHQGDGKGRAKLDLTLRPGINCRWGKKCSICASGVGHFKQPYLDLIAPGLVFNGTGIAGTLSVENGGSRGPNPGFYSTVPPMSALSGKSRLIDIAMSGKHHDVRIAGVELLQLIAWVDCNGPFLGEEEIRTIPDYGGGFLTRTAPVIDRFNIPQDHIPQRDAPVKQGSEPETGRQ